MTSADAGKGPAPVSAAEAPENRLADHQNATAGDADSQLSDSLPRPRKSSAHERELATASQAKGDGLPYDEEAPPLPDEAPPEDDGWEPQWDYNTQGWYFRNRLTGQSQWENPRIPEATPTNFGSYDRFANISSLS